MKYAIVSDIHSNLEALEAVLEDIRNNKVVKLICLGDIVGYGASPNECINLVKDNFHTVLMGNHDHAAIGKTRCEYFNPNARNAILWTKRVLGFEETEYLKTLPFINREDNIVYAHANLRRPDEWDYIIDDFQASLSFDRMLKAQLAFIGHSHVPVHFYNGDSQGYDHSQGKIEIDRNYSYIINVGSVGQPRDGNEKSCYVIYDIERNFFEYRRIKYDIKSAQKKILDAGLPEFLAERIENGK